MFSEQKYIYKYHDINIPKRFLIKFNIPSLLEDIRKYLLKRLSKPNTPYV